MDCRPFASVVSWSDVSTRVRVRSAPTASSSSTIIWESASTAWLRVLSCSCTDPISFFTASAFCIFSFTCLMRVDQIFIGRKAIVREKIRKDLKNPIGFFFFPWTCLRSFLSSLTETSCGVCVCARAHFGCVVYWLRMREKGHGQTLLVYERKRATKSVHLLFRSLRSKKSRRSFPHLFNYHPLLHAPSGVAQWFGEGHRIK
jgi:hypothetical protein